MIRLVHKDTFTMFQNKEKIFGIGTTPKFLGGMPFFIQLDVIPIGGEVRSSLLQVNEKEELCETSHYIGPTGTILLVELCEDQGRLIRKQDVQIKELQNQLADYEQELYGVWKRYLSIEQPSYLEGWGMEKISEHRTTKLSGGDC